MVKPMTVIVDWVFDQSAYKQLKNGHASHEMEDKWNIYAESETMHFYRSWTGAEIFRFTLCDAGDGMYSVSECMVEQSPDRYTETNEQTIVGSIEVPLRAIMGLDAVQPT